MGWEWEYDIGEKVRINSKAINGLPNSVNKEGVIVGHHTGKIYDYIIQLDNDTVRVKEEEIDLIKESE